MYWLFLLLVLSSPLSREQPLLTTHSHVLAAPDRVLVRFANPAARQACERLGYPVLRDIPQIDYSVLQVPYGRVDESIAELKRQKLVREAYPDRAYRLAYTPNDPLFPYQWNLFQMRVPTAWDIRRGSPEIVIAVLDTGIDYYHPDLASNIWHNPGEIPGNGLDDDRNGFIDDDIGWDFAYNDRDPMDDYGHGTACAGIVAAAGDNGLMMAGVAFQCQILCVKIGLSNGYSYDSMFAPAIIYAADMGAKVQSISYFSDDLTPALRAATDYAWSKGSLLVVAAGNYNEPYPLYPAGYDKAVGVAATTRSDSKASFSNLGSWVDVAAPGVDIIATTMGGGYTTGFAGTSAAAPNAAGVAALLWSLMPGARVETIRSALEYAALRLNDPVVGDFLNYGRVDAEGAFHLLQSVLFTGDGQHAVWYPIYPRILWISPHRLPATGGKVTIFGRYFGWNRFWGVVTLNRIRLPVLEWSDSRIVVQIPRGMRPGWLEVKVRGARSNPFRLNLDLPGSPMTTAPSDRQIVGLYGGGARLQGGYLELLEADGNSLIAQPRTDDQTITLKLLVRGLEKESVRTILCEYLRQYENTTSNAVEQIQLYDFATGSYPYGSFVTIYSGSARAEGPRTIQLELPGDVRRFVSYEGDLFVKIVVNTGNNSAKLLIDKLWFRWR